MADYTALKATATRLITANGSQVVIERTGSDTTWTKKFDPATQRVYWEDEESNVVYTAPGDTVVEYSGYAVFSSWPKSMVDGTLILVNDIRVLISVDVEVEPGDVLVTAASREYMVVPPVKKIAPADSVVVVQEINVRG